MAWRLDTKGLWASAGWGSDSGFAFTSCRSVTSGQGQASPSLAFPTVKPHVIFKLLRELNRMSYVKSVL